MPRVPKRQLRGSSPCIPTQATFCDAMHPFGLQLASDAVCPATRSGALWLRCLLGLACRQRHVCSVGRGAPSRFELQLLAAAHTLFHDEKRLDGSIYCAHADFRGPIDGGLTRDAPDPA